MLSVYFLGPLAVEAGATSIVLRYNKARALLAYLVLEHGFHTRESLAFLLWPDDSVQAGREKLKRMLFELKEALGSDFLEGNRDVLRMRTEAGIWTDVAEFTQAAEKVQRELKVDARVDLEQMAHAAGLYRGQFLQGLELEDAPDFSSWVQVRRERYQQSFLRAIRLLAEGHERNGELHLAIDRARQLTVAAPLADDHWRYFLQLLVKAGQNDRAHQEFEHYRHMLDVELGTSPDPAVARILEQPIEARRETPLGPSWMMERRQLTVVSCEFEASGDPEDVADMVGRQVARCDAIFHRASAHTVRTPSGGLLAYFGYPLAMEDSARRAVSAALACRPDDEEPSNGAHPLDDCVDVYIGVDTGVVISSAYEDVPDAGGTVSRRAMQVGNLGGNRVFVSGNTRRMLQEVFDFTFSGRLHDRSKGLDFDTFCVKGDLFPPSPSLCSSQDIFRGRQAELAQLRGIWRDDSAYACLVSGDAGLGKSFLIEHFMAHDQVNGVIFKCAAEWQQIPLRPFARWVAELHSGSDSPQNTPDEHADFIQRLRRVASLLSLAKTDGSTSMPAVDKERLTLELRRLIELTVPAGGVLCFDDVHWADPATREVLAALVEKPVPQRSLFIAARPEFVCPWRRSAVVEELALQPLEAQAVVELVQAVAGASKLTDDTLYRIVELAEGVPLYAEELTRDLLAEPGVTGNVPSSLDERVALALPRNLNDLLMSRIDSVGSVKPVAQFAAAAGGEFTVDLLQAAMDRPRADLTEAIAILLRHKLIVRLDDTRYVFRHALLREAAYQSQARPARLEAHRRFAQVLKQDLLSDHNVPESLAWHYMSAGDHRLAFKYAVLAARKAGARLAYREAVGYYRNALELFERGSRQTPSMDELDIRMELGVQLSALYGFGSPEAVEMFREALVLAQPFGDDPRLFPLYWGLWRGASSWADYGTAAELGQTLLRLALGSNDADLLVRAYLARGQTHVFQGKFHDAVAELEKGVEVHDPNRTSLTLGEDALTVCLGVLGSAYWHVGRSDDALRTIAASIARARRLDHRYSLLRALHLGCSMYRLRGDIDKVESLSTEAVQLARELGTPLWVEMGSSFLNWSRAARGNQDDLANIGVRFEKLTMLSSGLASTALMHWVSACELARDPGMGLQLIDKALAFVDEVQGVHAISELQRLKGTFLFGQNASLSIYLPWLERALDTALSMASPPLVLRAVLSLLRLAKRPLEDYLDVLTRNLDLVQGGSDQWEVCAALDVLNSSGGSSDTASMPRTGSQASGCPHP